MDYVVQGTAAVVSRLMGYPIHPTHSTTSSSFSASVPVNNHQTSNNINMNFNGPVDIKISNTATNVHGSDNKIRQTNKQSAVNSKPSKNAIESGPKMAQNKPVTSPEKVQPIEDVVGLNPRLLDMTKVQDLTKFTRSVRKHEQNGVPYFVPLGCKIIPLRTIAHCAETYFLAYVGVSPDKAIDVLRNGFINLAKEGVPVTLDPLYALSFVQDNIEFQTKKVKIILQVRVDSSVLQSKNTWANYFYRSMGLKDENLISVTKISSLVPYAVCLYPEY